jgi:hypothetical protein
MIKRLVSLTFFSFQGFTFWVKKVCNSKNFFLFKNNSFIVLGPKGWQKRSPPTKATMRL